MRSLLIILATTCIALSASLKAEDSANSWVGHYKGVYALSYAGGEQTIERPFTLEISRSGSESHYRLNFSKEEKDDLSVSIYNLKQRIESPHTEISKDRFYLPAIFAEPIEFEANRTKGGFDEEIIAGKITTYKLSIDKVPEVDMKIIFKAGFLR